MKKLLLSIMIILASLSCFAQKKEVPVLEDSNELIGIGFQFPISNDFTGSYWTPLFRILVDEEGYRITLMYPSSDYYYKFYDNESLYLKLDDESIVECPILTEIGARNYVMQGVYQNNVDFQDRKISQVDFRIEDYDQILGHQIVKIRFFLNEQIRDYDLKKDHYVKKFTKKFKDSARVAKADFKKKKFARDNPTAGF